VKRTYRANPPEKALQQALTAQDRLGAARRRQLLALADQLVGQLAQGLADPRSLDPSGFRRRGSCRRERDASGPVALTLGVSTTLLLAAAARGSRLPVPRALRVDPVVAPRYE
jgi:hypothetical protein